VRQLVQDNFALDKDPSLLCPLRVLPRSFLSAKTLAPNQNPKGVDRRRHRAVQLALLPLPLLAAVAVTATNKRRRRGRGGRGRGRLRPRPRARAKAGLQVVEGSDGDGEGALAGSQVRELHAAGPVRRGGQAGREGKGGRERKLTGFFGSGGWTARSISKQLPAARERSLLLREMERGEKGGRERREGGRVRGRGRASERHHTHRACSQRGSRESRESSASSLGAKISRTSETGRAEARRVPPADALAKRSCPSAERPLIRLRHQRQRRGAGRQGRRGRGGGSGGGRAAAAEGGADSSGPTCRQ
jgi:hypothetical protein